MNNYHYLKEDILDYEILIVKPQHIANICYGLLGMGIVIYAINHFTTT